MSFRFTACRGVCVYRGVGLVVGRSAVPGRAMGVSKTAVLLERESVLEEVEQDLAAARAGAGRFVLIKGPAGIGKSAVLGAVRGRGEGMGMVVARARGAELESESRLGLSGSCSSRCCAAARGASGGDCSAGEQVGLVMLLVWVRTE